MRQYFLYLLFGCVSFLHMDFVCAQTKDSDMVKKGKYEKAAKRIEKKLSKNPHDAIFNYDKANLLIQRKYKNYNPEEAYTCCIIALKNWEDLDKKNINEPTKFYFPKLLGNCIDTIYYNAYKDAVTANTFESYQRFLDYFTYLPINRARATEMRNELAYQRACEINTEESFQQFIDSYPDAKQVQMAMERKDITAFNKAQKEKISDSFNKFIVKYPKSDLYYEAFNLFYELKFGTKNFDSHDTVLDFYDELTKDGEKITLDLFFNIFSNNDLSSLSDRKAEDYRIAILGEQLQLHAPYDTKKFQKYDEYIRLAAPREKAFVALQRMISIHIEKKEWQPAIDMLKKYLPYWGEENSKILGLISILEHPDNASVKIISAGENINLPQGSAYMPVLLDRTNTLYFSGKNRQENIGGEDIFESVFGENGYENVKLAPGTSLKEKNEVPLDISTDGLEMLIFRDGKIVCLERGSTTGEWHETTKYAELNNFGGWVSDVMIANGGKAILFASNMWGGKNLHSQNDGVTFFHGDMQYQSDIYVVVQDSDGRWGEPVNLGHPINTLYSERTPFLHHDNKTLYFSSDGHGGLGKMDVYKSVRLRDDCWDCWSVPVNMGKEINTSGNDIGFKITEDGRKAYFSKDEYKNPTSSLLLLLDVSGSMNLHGKLDALKQVAKNVCITGIQNDTEISILTFDGSCYAPVRSELNFTKNYDEINEFIDKIAALHLTPMYEAYDYACNYMKKFSSDTENKMIILMTDGEANGCKKLDDILSDIKKKRLIYKTQTIGFDVKENSKPYNDLHKISAVTNGKYYHAAEPNDLGVAFENAIKDWYDMALLSSKKGIYTFDIPAELRPENVVRITGKTATVKGENKPVDIRIVDLVTHKEVYRTKSDPDDGTFYFVVPLGNIYGIHVDDISIYPISDHIDLRKVEKAVHIIKDIPLITIDEMMKDHIAIPVNNLFFDFASAEILPLSVPELKLHAKIIKSANYNVEISGYTDDKGSASYNLDLSQRRADAVKEFLIKEGCAPERIASVGYGIRRFDTNQTEAGRARNRRVELVFRKDE